MVPVSAAAALLGLLATAGCANFSMQPPVTSSATVAGSPTNTEPQSPNSLPLGSQVQSPFTPAEGNLTRTVVALPPNQPAGPTPRGYLPAVPTPSP